MTDDWNASIFWHPGGAGRTGRLPYEGPKGNGLSMPIARKGANSRSGCDRWSGKRLPCTVLSGKLMVSDPQ